MPRQNITLRFISNNNSDTRSMNCPLETGYISFLNPITLEWCRLWDSFTTNNHKYPYKTNHTYSFSAVVKQSVNGYYNISRVKDIIEVPHIDMEWDIFRYEYVCSNCHDYIYARERIDFHECPFCCHTGSIRYLRVRVDARKEEGVV